MMLYMTTSRGQFRRQRSWAEARKRGQPRRKPNATDSLGWKRKLANKLIYTGLVHCRPASTMASCPGQMFICKCGCSAVKFYLSKSSKVTCLENAQLRSHMEMKKKIDK